MEGAQWNTWDLHFFPKLGLKCKVFNDQGKAAKVH